MQVTNLHALASRAQALALAGLALAMAGPVARGAAAQPSEQRAYVSVLDQQGTPVTEVTPADLAIREDGVAREVLRVGPASTPMEVVLLVDNSQATTADTPFVRDALEAFVAALDDRHAIGVVTLGDRPTLVLGATTNAEAVTRAVTRIFPQPNSGTYLLDAVRETTRGFAKRKPERPVVIAVVREDVEFGTGDHATLVEALRDTHAAFHAIVLTTPGVDPSMGTFEGRERVQLIAKGTADTGGRRADLLSNMALKPTMVELAAELNAQLEATFSRPASLIPPKRTTVTSAREGWTVRGTLAPPASQPQ